MFVGGTTVYVEIVEARDLLVDTVDALDLHGLHTQHLSTFCSASLPVTATPPNSALKLPLDLNDIKKQSA